MVHGSTPGSRGEHFGQAEDQSEVANLPEGFLSSHQLNELLCKVVVAETEVTVESMEKKKAKERQQGDAAHCFALHGDFALLRWGDATTSSKMPGWNVLNRTVTRLTLFEKPEDYEEFERVLRSRRSNSVADFFLLSDAQSLALCGSTKDGPTTV